MSKPTRSYDTVVIGGGQAGLATSYHLSQHGHDHVVLEQASHVGDAWRNQRWDSFTLVTPNWAMMMPGAEYDGPDREAFMTRDQVVAYFDQYVERFKLPVRYNTRVVSVEPMDGGGFRLQTNDGTYQASNVVVATGYERLPRIPAGAAGFAANLMQLHSSQYRNPHSLPAGAVLVVGSGQSGSQIAEELYQSGRRVFLCTGRTGRAPRRYRGKDIFEWLYRLGFFDIPADKFPVPVAQFTAPHVSGGDGGHTLNLHQFARDGVTLLGHFRSASGYTASLAPDLHENLARVDGFERQARNMVDGYIRANGLEAPAEELPQLRDGYEQPIIEELDLQAAGIQTVIWATGFTADYSFINLPVTGPDGFPIGPAGVSPHAGLYFVGVPWMPSLKTGILAGVGPFSERIVSHIAAAEAVR